MSDRQWDLALYGATGFTGRQAARYLAAHAPAGLRWAVAGRDRARLEEVRTQTGAPGLVVADSGRPESVDALAAGARVVITTAGPFARYGGPVVEACARHRTHYADITGETWWVRGLVDRFHESAAAQATRLVPFCGFDSVPSDLGTLLVASWLRREWGQATRRVSASFALRGGLNGGTFATALDSARSVPPAAARDVLLLHPPGRATEAERARSAEFEGARFDADRGVWLAPFVMAPINTRVVRRSNALLAEAGEGYGPEFAYEEASEAKTRVAARLMSAGLRVGDWLTRAEAGRALLQRIGPKPGEGPSRETLERGFFRARFVGEAADGRKVLATLACQGDPGNVFTVSALCEAGLALATDLEKLPGGPRRGGVLTPATALGLALLERLKRAGVEVEVGPLR